MTLLRPQDLDFDQEKNNLFVYKDLYEKIEQGIECIGSSDAEAFVELSIDELFLIRKHIILDNYSLRMAMTNLKEQTAHKKNLRKD